jgi:transcription elongation GreA/GreB family factor
MNKKKHDLKHLLLVVENSPQDFGDPHRETIDRLRQMVEKNPDFLTNPPQDIVDIGSTVTLRDLANDSTLIFTVTDPANADVFEGKVSVLSPLGITVLGRRPGEVFKFESPGGIVEYELVEVE